MTRRFICALLCLFIAACAAPRRPAPVVDRAPAKPPTAAVPAAPAASAATAASSAGSALDRAESYTIRRGDTLYGIALDHGLDYREIAEWNALANPDVIREGQVLRLRPAAGSAQSASGVQVNPVTSVGAVTARPLGESQPTTAKTEPRAATQTASVQPKLEAPKSEPPKSEPPKSEPPKSEPPKSGSTKAEAAKPEGAKPEAPKTEAGRPAASEGDDGVDWSWPASGRLVARFAEPANKGVDIAGRKGEPVLASAGGRVVYSGEGLRGYGKLIIIKHNNTYLSAYAHNDSILVKEGQSVTRGQKIAEIGSTGTDQAKLHFEIRRLGKPVDPLKFLPERPS
jgi:lipoprotein NlpD